MFQEAICTTSKNRSGAEVFNRGGSSVRQEGAGSRPEEFASLFGVCLKYTKAVSVEHVKSDEGMVTRQQTSCKSAMFDRANTRKGMCGTHVPRCIIRNNRQDWPIIQTSHNAFTHDVLMYGNSPHRCNWT